MAGAVHVSTSTDRFPSHFDPSSSDRLPPTASVRTLAVDGTAGDVSSSVASLPIATVFVCLYGVVFVLGVFGNSLVVYVVASNKSMQTATNLFIGNLAAADVMMCLLAVPFTPLSGLLR